MIGRGTFGKLRLFWRKGLCLLWMIIAVFGDDVFHSKDSQYIDYVDISGRLSDKNALIDRYIINRPLRKYVELFPFIVQASYTIVAGELKQIKFR